MKPVTLQQPTEDSHGKNSIEAAGEKAVKGLQAATDTGGDPNQGTTAEGGVLEGISQRAAKIASSAASSLGATVPEANKVGLSASASERYRYVLLQTV